MTDSSVHHAQRAARFEAGAPGRPAKGKGRHGESSDSDSILLQRPRLDALLTEALRRDVVSVCASAGYGKTDAVRAYVRGLDADITWIQVTASDNFEARFWESFTHAVGRHDEPLARRLREFGFPGTEADYERYVTIPERALKPGRKRVVVYDDFHLIRDRRVLGFIERCVHTPIPDLTTVFIGRTEPDVGLLDMISRGRVADITERDLRLTEPEIAELLHAHGLSVSEQTLHEIHEDTHGWLFAVKLVVGLLKRSPESEFHAQISVKSDIFALLEAEVFLPLQERLRRFLVRLSLIDHPYAEIVRTLAGDDPGLLDDLAQVHAYVRYDSYLGGYHIHSFFLDFLRGKQDMLTSNEKREVYRRAARWHEDNKRLLDAVAYYEKAGDNESVLRIAYGMPSEVPEKTARYFLRILENMRPRTAARLVLYPVVYLRLLISLARYDDAVAAARRFIETHEALPESAFGDRVLSEAYAALGFVSLLRAPQTDVYDFDAYFEKAHAYYMRHPYETDRPPRNQRVGTTALKIGTERPGAPEEFIEAATRAVRWRAHSSGGNLSGMDDLARAELGYYRGDLKTAESHLARAREITWENSQYGIYGLTLLYLVRLGFAQGDYAKIVRVLQALDKLRDASDYANRYHVHDIVMGWYWLRLNQPPLIADWLKVDFERGALPRTIETLGNRIRLRYYYATGRYEELLSFLAVEEELKKTLFGRLDVKVRETACRYRIDDREGAFRTLRRAYEIHRSNNLVMPFIELGKDMRTLALAAIRAQAAGIPRDWLEMMNRRSATHAKQRQIVISAYREANHMSDGIRLSPRETDILADLYRGLSRAEIALNRRLSINTVKLFINS
ncbi:MAG: hypothetical protein LBS70_03320, partial [Candidatus Accumulibacter sp.]|nr:hypothetical protein [Accumulibacter sp.]